MNKIIGWFKTTKWVALAALAVVLAALGFVLRSLFHTPEKPAGAAGPQRLPEVPKPLKQAVAKAEEEALVARVTAKAKADAEKERLARTLANPDGVARRKELAAMAKDL